MAGQGQSRVRRTGQHPPVIARFVWIVWMLLAILLVAGLAAAAGCTPAATPIEPTETAEAIVHAEPAFLQVVVKPAGASVLVDDRAHGVTPLSLSLPPGKHVVRVEKSGHQTLEQTVVLSSGRQAVVEGSLADVTSPTLTIQLFPEQPTPASNWSSI